MVARHLEQGRLTPEQQKIIEGALGGVVGEKGGPLHFDPGRVIDADYGLTDEAGSVPVRRRRERKEGEKPELPYWVTLLSQREDPPEGTVPKPDVEPRTPLWGESLTKYDSEKGVTYEVQPGAVRRLALTPLELFLRSRDGAHRAHKEYNQDQRATTAEGARVQKRNDARVAIGNQSRWGFGPATQALYANADTYARPLFGGRSQQGATAQETFRATFEHTLATLHARAAPAVIVDNAEAGKFGTQLRTEVGILMGIMRGFQDTLTQARQHMIEHVRQNSGQLRTRLMEELLTADRVDLNDHDPTITDAELTGQTVRRLFNQAVDTATACQPYEDFLDNLLGNGDGITAPEVIVDNLLAAAQPVLANGPIFENPFTEESIDQKTRDRYGRLARITLRNLTHDASVGNGTMANLQDLLIDAATTGDGGPLGGEYERVLPEMTVEAALAESQGFIVEAVLSGNLRDVLSLEPRYTVGTSRGIMSALDEHNPELAAFVAESLLRKTEPEHPQGSIPRRLITPAAAQATAVVTSPRTQNGVLESLVFRGDGLSYMNDVATTVENQINVKADPSGYVVRASLAAASAEVSRPPGAPDELPQDWHAFKLMQAARILSMGIGELATTEKQLEDLAQIEAIDEHDRDPSEARRLDVEWAGKTAAALAAHLAETIPSHLAPDFAKELIDSIIRRNPGLAMRDEVVDIFESLYAFSYDPVTPRHDRETAHILSRHMGRLLTQVTKAIEPNSLGLAKKRLEERDQTLDNLGRLAMCLPDTPLPYTRGQVVLRQAQESNGTNSTVETVLCNLGTLQNGWDDGLDPRIAELGIPGLDPSDATISRQRATLAIAAHLATIITGDYHMQRRAADALVAEDVDSEDALQSLRAEIRNETDNVRSAQLETQLRALEEQRETKQLQTIGPLMQKTAVFETEFGAFGNFIRSLGLHVGLSNLEVTSTDPDNSARGDMYLTFTNSHPMVQRLGVSEFDTILQVFRGGEIDERTVENLVTAALQSSDV